MYFRGVSVSNKAKECCETVSTSLYYLNWIARCRKEEEEYKKRVQKKAKLKINKANPNTNNFSKQENIPQKIITVKPGCISLLKIVVFFMEFMTILLKIVLVFLLMVMFCTLIFQ